MNTGDLEVAAAHFSHRELLGRIVQAANLFRSLGVTPDSGPVAFLCPALAHMQVALLGAQVAGVASSINYLLTADAVADLLIAENAEVLMIPSAADDPESWHKAATVMERVPSLRFVLVIGGDSDLPRKMMSFDAARPGVTSLSFSSTPTAPPFARCFIPAGRPAAPSSFA
jgi:fatty-acyl-CoA synthase